MPHFERGQIWLEFAWESGCCKSFARSPGTHQIDTKISQADNASGVFLAVRTDVRQPEGTAKLEFLPLLKRNSYKLFI